MAKITIDGKEYEIEKLPHEAIELINSIVFVDGELQKLNNQLIIYKFVRNFYLSKLKELLDNLDRDSISKDNKINFS